MLIVTSHMIKTNWWYDRMHFASFLNCTVATHFKNQSTESTESRLLFFFGLLRHIGSIAQISLNSDSCFNKANIYFARVFKYYYPYRTGIFTPKKNPLRSSVLQFVKTPYQHPDSVECKFKFVKSLNTFHLWPIFMQFKNSKFNATIFWRNWLKSSYHFLSSYNLWYYYHVNTSWYTCSVDLIL